MKKFLILIPLLASFGGTQVQAERNGLPLAGEIHQRQMALYPSQTHAADPNEDTPAIGIGQFEKNQILVLNFMSHVGWNESTEYEETGLKMKSLLIKMVTMSPAARQWLEEVNKYFDSAAFAKLGEIEKKKDIFDAKIYAKMAIKDLGLVP